MNVEMSFVFAVVAALSVSLVTLVGFVYCLTNARFFAKLLPWILSLTVGVLLGNAFFHLVPEAMHEVSHPLSVWFWLAVGFLVFFVLNKFLAPHRHGEEGILAIKPIGYLNLLGDGLHNFIDGLVIGASFMIHVEVGLATSLAILVHELLQELGDSGTLIYSGFKPRRAVKLNFLVSLTTLLGVIAVFGISNWFVVEPAILIAFTAGGFIYMAIGNLVPELWHRHSKSYGMKAIYLAVVGVGMVIVFGIGQFQPHVHTHGRYPSGDSFKEHVGLPFGSFPR